MKHRILFVNNTNRNHVINEWFRSCLPCFICFTLFSVLTGFFERAGSGMTIERDKIVISWTEWDWNVWKCGWLARLGHYSCDWQFIHIRFYWDFYSPKNILSIILLDIYIIRLACAKCRYNRLQCVPSVVQMYNVKPPSFKSTL